MIKEKSVVNGTITIGLWMMRNTPFLYVVLIDYKQKVITNKYLSVNEISLILRYL